LFHLPIVTLVDEPGFMIGPEAENAATIMYGTSVVLAAQTCVVPWATVLVRKTFGVAGAAHFSENCYVLAWPSAESGALPVEGGVAVAFGKEIAAAENPEKRRLELEVQFRAAQTPFPRGEQLAVHELIDPKETRPFLCEWMETVQPLLPALLGETRFSFKP
jgi:acetyl-CoA carboxylase carboxyltransferase component